MSGWSFRWISSSSADYKVIKEAIFKAMASNPKYWKVIFKVDIAVCMGNDVF